AIRRARCQWCSPRLRGVPQQACRVEHHRRRGGPGPYSSSALLRPDTRRSECRRDASLRNFTLLNQSISHSPPLAAEIEMWFMGCRATEGALCIPKEEIL